jgi:hypothetical protein
MSSTLFCSLVLMNCSVVLHVLLLCFFSKLRFMYCIWNSAVMLMLTYGFFSFYTTVDLFPLLLFCKIVSRANYNPVWFLQTRLNDPWSLKVARSLVVVVVVNPYCTKHLSATALKTSDLPVESRSSDLLLTPT